MIAGPVHKPVSNPKEAMRDYWEQAVCGDVYAVGDTLAGQLAAQARTRYALEPYIRPFALFDGHDKRVLEVGVGMGADHAEWAKSRPARLVGVDLTAAGIELTRQRLLLMGLSSELLTADAEKLPFPDDTFDIVYSWGVLHYTPDTERAVSEVYRVLRPGGVARIMVYHRPSLVGVMLWIRYGLLLGRPGRSQADLYAHHLQSPGCKGYTVEEGRQLVRQFSSSELRIQLSFGDLLEGSVGRQHGGWALETAKRIWPRPIIRRFLPSWGLMLLIRAVKGLPAV